VRKQAFFLLSPIFFFLLTGIVFGESLYSSATETIPVSAPRMVYPDSYGAGTQYDHRFFLWLFIQQHFYLGSFILGTPMIAWFLELFAYFRRKDGQEARTLDRLAHDIICLGLPFYPFTLISGMVLLSGFMLLYPVFFQYMASLFKPILYLYALSFFLESLLLYGYAATWNRFSYLDPQTVHSQSNLSRKSIHLAIGGLLFINGVAIISLANALMSFMMSPKGVDLQGRFEGSLWAMVHTPFWNPLNVHRVMASIMFSGAVIAAYSAFKMLTTSDPDERARYDRMGHITIGMAIANLFLLPFAGYWFAKEIFVFRQRMGMTLMGGALTWLFVIQAMLIGFIFMAIIYYLWQGTARMEGSGRYRHLLKYLLMIMLVSFLVWTTPHTIPATQGEFQVMGGTQHPIVGYYGTMSAKNTAINTMILTCGLCLIIFKRCNRVMTITWRRWGNGTILGLFVVAEGVILALGVYGYRIPAHVRVALAFPQFMIAIGTLLISFFINGLMLKGANDLGPIRWGKLPASGSVALFVLAFLITTTMALMGYIRSSVRLNWHITEIMEDVTPWAHTPSLLYGIGMILFNVVLFLLISIFIFRAMGKRGVAAPISSSEETSLPRLEARDR
jgi:cytochrome bd-type quinol oxidase subunit 1